MSETIIEESIFAIVVFATTRYSLPNYILNKKIIMYEMFITSLCYAFCAFLRMLFKKYIQTNDKQMTNK